MPTAAPEQNRPDRHTAPGEINLDFIPQDWALTPLREKRAYTPGWTSKPFSVDQIRSELEEGRATGVGLISGQWSNEGGLACATIVRGP